MSSQALRSTVFLSLLLWICGTQRLKADNTAAAPPAAPDAVGLIHFRAPADWKAVDQPGKALRMYVAPDSTAKEQAAILVALADRKEITDFRAEFDAMVKKALENEKISSAGEVTASRSRQGFPALSQTLTLQTPEGQQAKAWFVAANVDGRVALFWYLASLPDTYPKHRADADKLLASVSFDAAPAAAVGDPNANPTDTAKAVEDWARDAAGRRKPHTVLGDITNSQGRPIKGLKGTVYVGGTTIRGDRSSYTLDVDDNGHFEMAVPDGVYRLTPTLTIEYDGQDLPVQLRSLDGKDPGKSFSSAEGIVRDYRWVLTGVKASLKPDHYVNFYGGHITLEDASPGGWGHLLKDRTPPGTKLHFVLTPTGPLVDGSEARPMQLEVDVAILATAARDGIATVPIGVYKAAAELLAPDGRKQRLWLSFDSINPKRANEVEIHWVKEGYLDDVKTIRIWISDAP